MQQRRNRSKIILCILLAMLAGLFAFSYFFVPEPVQQEQVQGVDFSDLIKKSDSKQPDEYP